MKETYSGIILSDQGEDSFFVAEHEEIGTIHASYHKLPKKRKIKFLKMVEKWVQDELKKYL